MIQKIKIENYKSIQSLDFELGRLNVIIGENGSGKSNILEAIAMGSAAGEHKLSNDILASRGIRITDPVSMKSGFSKDTSQGDIEINFNDSAGKSYNHSLSHDVENPFSEWEDHGAVALGDLRATDLDEESPVFKSRNGKIIKSEIGFNQLLRKSSRKIYSNFLIYAPENYALRQFQEEAQIEPLGIRGAGLFKLLSILNKDRPDQFQKIREQLNLIDWFDGFEIPGDLQFTERRIRIKDRFLEDGLEYFDQRSSNEGFLYLLFYFSLFISDYTPNFFAIDNIDNSLNPKLCAELVKILARLAKEHNKQVILTTHNPAVLDGLNLNDDEQRLLVVYRNAYGHTKVNRILPKSLPEGSNPVRLSEQFLRGYIGGLPKNF
ncbi:AAA family ATPase [Dyadobacter psychrotolerans]|uniref:Chromosome segregation protein SMC n=1 Tax=Dyadobacter psychrotolerans TaxID=2541721 RepID=A0A4R5D8T7_9BACT|nr:AAA family ATPase [Dyadobacter psychrotolerans]TDE09979.1 chromosome segregation protein SMC [Dyadobacter psychrotolerans]